MKYRLLFCAFFALAILAASFAELGRSEIPRGSKGAVILVIRHAEDADNGYGLSPLGNARANAYASYFKHFTIDGQPLKLDYIFATSDSRNSHRPRLTVEPTAEALGLAIDSRFKNKQIIELTEEIMSRPRGANILICWHHGKIPQLLRALGADPKILLPNGKWPDDEFSWLVQLRYDVNGHLFESKRINTLSVSLTPKPERAFSLGGRPQLQ